MNRPRFLRQPDVPFTGIAQPYQLLFDPFVIASVVAVVALELTLSLTAAEGQLLVLLCVPAVIWRGGRKAAVAKPQEPAAPTEMPQSIIDLRDAIADIREASESPAETEPRKLHIVRK